MSKKEEEKVIVGVAAALLIIAIIILEPVLYFIGGYITGFITKIFISSQITAGLEMLGIIIMPDKLPLLGGVLGWIGGFFKSVASAATRKS